MSTIQETTRDIVARAYEAISTGDIPAFLEQLAEDAVLVEADGHPAGGRYEGRDAIEQAFPKIAGALGLRGLVVHRVIVDGDHAVGLLDMLCTTKSGEEYTMPVAEIWVVRDGKAVELRPYCWDLAELAARAAA